MSKTKLEACPFCGTEELRSVNIDVIHLIVEGNDCILNGITTTIKRWNSRSLGKGVAKVKRKVNITQVKFALFMQISCGIS